MHKIEENIFSFERTYHEKQNPNNPSNIYEKFQKYKYKKMMIYFLFIIRRYH